MSRLAYLTDDLTSQVGFGMSFEELALACAGVILEEFEIDEVSDLDLGTFVFYLFEDDTKRERVSLPKEGFLKRLGHKIKEFGGKITSGVAKFKAERSVQKSLPLLHREMPISTRVRLRTAISNPDETHWTRAQIPVAHARPQKRESDLRTVKRRAGGSPSPRAGTKTVVRDSPLYKEPQLPLRVKTSKKVSGGGSIVGARREDPFAPTVRLRGASPAKPEKTSKTALSTKGRITPPDFVPTSRKFIPSETTVHGPDSAEAPTRISRRSSR